MDFWQVFPAALALMLILEGLMPFINPRGWRSMVAQLSQMDDRIIRNVGLGSMAVGVLLLYWVN